MRRLYLLLYLVLGYALFVRLYVPNESDGSLQELAFPAITFIGFSAFICLFFVYLNLWSIVARPRLMKGLLKFGMPGALLVSSFSVQSMLSRTDRAISLALIVLLCDFHGLLEKQVFELYVAFSQKYPDRIFNGKLPSVSEDLWPVDLMVLVLFFVVVFVLHPW